MVTKVLFNATTLFDIKPYSYQLEILEKLQTERLVHNRTKNLVVAAMEQVKQLFPHLISTTFTEKIQLLNYYLLLTGKKYCNKQEPLFRVY